MFWIIYNPPKYNIQALPKVSWWSDTAKLTFKPYFCQILFSVISRWGIKFKKKKNSPISLIFDYDVPPRVWINRIRLLFAYLSALKRNSQFNFVRISWNLRFLSYLIPKVVSNSDNNYMSMYWLCSLAQ